MQQRRTLKLYDPHQGQVKAHNLVTRFNAICWGRQSGKTTFGLNKMADRAWCGPRDGIYWYILQTYSAAEVAFRRLYNFFLKCPSAFAQKPNLSGLTAQFHHGPVMAFKSGRNFEDLRVETLSGVVIDEYRQQHKDLWPLVVRPMLSAKQGWGDILSTPNGFDHFYDMFEGAKVDSEWGHLHAPSTHAPWWTPEEVESAKRTMSEAEFAQEILAEFRDLTRGKAYYATQANYLTRSPFVLTDDPESSVLSQMAPYLPIHLYCDWNVTYMGWTLSQFRNGSGHYAFDEVYLERSNTHEAADVLIAKLRGYATEGLLMRADPQIILVGDATGKAQKTSASGETDFTILVQKLKSAGFTVQNRTPESNPNVKDRINTVNARLAPASGPPQAMLNPKRCPMLKRDLERVVWKQNATGAVLDQITTPELTHLTDGWGYGICVTNPLAGIGGVGKLSVIPR